MYNCTQAFYCMMVCVSGFVCLCVCVRVCVCVNVAAAMRSLLRCYMVHGTQNVNGQQLMQT